MNTFQPLLIDSIDHPSCYAFVAVYACVLGDAYILPIPEAGKI
jgi:hypothetical protein